MVKNIGLLEDNDTFSMYLTLLLQRMGFDTASYRTLEDLESNPLVEYDLIFVGDSIKGSTTLSAVSHIKPFIKHTRIIVVSTISDSAYIDQVRAAGADEYLLKPVIPKTLHEAVVGNLEFPSDKRKNMRATIHHDSNVTIDGVTVVLPLLSLSRGGALIGTETSLPTGSKVQVDLPVKALGCPVNGIVIYNRKTQGEHAGTALLFTGLSNAEANLIDEYLENDLLLQMREEIPSLSEKMLPGILKLIKQRASYVE